MIKFVLSFSLLTFSLLLASCQASYLPREHLVMILPVLPVADSVVATPTRFRFEYIRRTPTAHARAAATLTVNNDSALSTPVTPISTPTPFPSSETRVTLSPALSTPVTPTARPFPSSEARLTLTPALSTPVTPTATPTATRSSEATVTLTPTITASTTKSVDNESDEFDESRDALTPTPFLVAQEEPDAMYPTLAHFWEGWAEFELDIINTGLPMGESETIVMSNGEMWSYLHASNQSEGVVDQCGDPVPFPGCVIIYKSYDGGYTFHSDASPICQFKCNRCPCRSDRDHIDQQQYPRVFFDGQRLTMFYEYRAATIMRHSWDGLNWSEPDRVLRTGIWTEDLRPCAPAERIKEHPFTFEDVECLAGGPPGIYIEDNRTYLFVAVGQNPSGMGCYVTNSNSPGYSFSPCKHYQLFSGSWVYGPPHEKGPHTNEYFDFRTISSAEVQKIGSGEKARYYMFYEGVRGPGEFDDGDSQFGLGLARSLTNRIDGPWEKYPDNPILIDLPGNIGLGHADLVIYKGQTLLYTSLEGVHRSRLSLIWK